MGQVPHPPHPGHGAGDAVSGPSAPWTPSGLWKWLCDLPIWRRCPPSEDTGRQGEELAARHLIALGYRILARNFRVRGGEADLLATKDGWIIVVEVKARRSLRFGSPAEAVRGHKSRRVLRAGRIYCRRNGLSLAKLRGDVVTVEWPQEGGAPHVHHWTSALTDARSTR